MPIPNTQIGLLPYKLPQTPYDLFLYSSKECSRILDESRDGSKVIAAKWRLNARDHETHELIYRTGWNNTEVLFALIHRDDVAEIVCPISIFRSYHNSIVQVLPRVMPLATTRVGTNRHKIIGIANREVQNHMRPNTPWRFWSNIETYGSLFDTGIKIHLRTGELVGGAKVEVPKFLVNKERRKDWLKIIKNWNVIMNVADRLGLIDHEAETMDSYKYTRQITREDMYDTMLEIMVKPALQPKDIRRLMEFMTATSRWHLGKLMWSQDLTGGVRGMAKNHSVGLRKHLGVIADNPDY